MVVELINSIFKSKSYKHLENELKNLPPGGDLKAYPHVYSKIKDIEEKLRNVV